MDEPKRIEFRNAERLEQDFSEEEPNNENEKEQNNNEEPDKEQSIKSKKYNFHVIVVFILVFLFLLIAVIILQIYKEDSEPPKSLTSIRATIPNYNYSQRIVFYLLAHSKESEDFIRLDVVFHFPGLNGKECFLRNEVLYRDVVYRFFKNQTPASNTQPHWTEIVEHDLIGYIDQGRNPCSITSAVLELFRQI